MSRINDALKQARQAQRQTPPSALTPLPPVAPRPGPAQMARETDSPGSAIGWIWPGVVGFLIVTACLLIGLALVMRTPIKTAGDSNPPVAQPVKLTATPIPTPTSKAPPVAIPVPSSPPPPKTGLQGIVYTATRPWAIVNGQTVQVGDQLGEFRVVSISQHDVTLEKADGSQKKLILSE
jgi:hypothetical protein